MLCYLLNNSLNNSMYKLGIDDLRDVSALKESGMRSEGRSVTLNTSR